MKTGWIDGSASLVADELASLFAQHGVESFRDGDTLHFPAHGKIWVNGAAYRGYPRALQLDVHFGIEPDCMLCESVAGFGTEDEPAIRDGLAAFARSCLPVLLAAFFDRPLLTTRERWTIGGGKRLVGVGEVTSRFGFPRDADGNPDIRFFHHFKRHLEAAALPPGTHWIRVYHMRMENKVMANEVLLDNTVWHEMQDAMAAFDWPPSDAKTYDVRVLLVLQDAE